jgi:predicted ATPase
MRFVYADNFRGFSRALIPLKQVNFFLGENSSGKSSLLSLISLLSSHHFWLNQDFNTPEVHLGSWNDIVSAESKNKKSFSVGFVGTQDIKQDDGASVFDAYSFLLTYMSDDGIPVPSRYRVIANDMLWDFAFKKKHGYFNIWKLDEDEKSFEGIHQIFNRWIDEKKEPVWKHTISDLPDNRKTLLPLLQGMVAVSSKEASEELRPKVLIPLPNVKWIAPIRTKPKRTYDEDNVGYSPEGEHTPYLLRKLKKDKEKKKHVDKTLCEFGQKSGLFKEISIHNLGKVPNSPFTLDVHLEKEPISLDNVGYGVSQSLPVIVELIAGKKGDWYAIQQPEVHLHPKAQAALGEMIYDLASKNECTLHIETHSDFLIDRFRLRLSEDNQIQSQVLFFERRDGQNHVYPIKIQQNGQYDPNQPDGFREFFMAEQMRLLRMGG